MILIPIILYLTFAGFLVSKMKSKEDGALMMIFVVVIGVILLGATYKASRCDAIGNCAELDTYAID